MKAEPKLQEELPRHPKVEPKDVAVVVAAKDEAENIRPCVESLLKACPESEIIVVDDGSTDETSSILSSFEEKIAVLKGQSRGPGAARNLALQHTTKPWIAFTDADCEVDLHWLDELCRGISGREGRVASIGGLQRVSSRAEKKEADISLFLEVVGFVSDYVHGDDQNIKEVEHNPTCTVLYSRKAIERENGFDETLWPTEDLDLDYRLDQRGMRALFTPKAIVYHRRPKTWRAFGKMMNRYGFAHAQFMKKHGISQKIHVLPFVFPFLLGVFTALLLFRTYIGWLFLAVVMLPVFLLFLFQTKRPWVSVVFSGVLVYSVTRWLMGFFKGMIGRRRVFRTGA